MGEPEKKTTTPETPASRTWLVSHVPHVGLEPTDTDDRMVKCGNEISALLTTQPRGHLKMILNHKN